MTDRSDDEIRADLAVRPADGHNALARYDDARERLAFDAGPLLDRAVAAERENEQLLARIADYENAINWGISCTNCANLMDQIYELDQVQVPAMRAELAAARRVIEAVKAVSNRLRDYRGGFIQEGALRADVAPTEDGEPR